MTLHLIQLLPVLLALAFSHGYHFKKNNLKFQRGYLNVLVWFITYSILIAGLLFMNDFDYVLYFTGLLIIVIGAIMRSKAKNNLGNQYSEFITVSDVKLVSNGIYGKLLHPLHLGIVIETIGLCLIQYDNSFLKNIPIIITFFICYLNAVIRNKLEESSLTSILGEPYINYKVKLMEKPYNKLLPYFGL